MAQQELSPLTGIIEEDQVVCDFGEHEGKSILEINDEIPEFYEYLLLQKEEGRTTIRRTKDKSFRLYVSRTLN
jgi:broad specificity phosphatase PhoE